MSYLARHEQALRASFERDLASGLDPEEPRRQLAMLSDGTCPRWLAVFLAQRSDGAYDLLDGYASYVLMSWWRDGWVAFAHTRVGVGPVADKLADENNARLSGLQPPYRARFAPMLASGYCDDGAFYWDARIQLGARAGSGSEASYFQDAGRAPFEVGLTKSSRTIQHLMDDGGVARWAYGSAFITLGLVTEAGREALGVNAVVSADEAQRALEARAVSLLGIVGDWQ